MMAEEIPTAVETLSRALARERVQSARHINLVRVCGVSAFFVLFIVLGVVLRLPGWTGNLGLFTAYWLVAAVPAAAARVMFLTGDTADAETERFLRDAGRPVLTKPLALEPLALALTPLLLSAAHRLRS